MNPILPVIFSDWVYSKKCTCDGVYMRPLKTNKGPLIDSSKLFFNHYNYPK
jgi:hypothetical protein